MAEKNFWQEKWLKDQYNERNAGQRNDPQSPKPEPKAPSADDVLRAMLNTPPQPHTQASTKTPRPRKKKNPPK